MCENEECYIFVPSNHDKSSQQVKRRKIVPAVARESSLTGSFVPLLRGTEHAESVKSRQKTYEKQCRAQQAFIQQMLANANSNTVAGLVKFIEASSSTNLSPKIATGLLVQNPGERVARTAFKAVTDILHKTSRTLCITLKSGESPNLKATLRNINRSAITQIQSREDIQIETQIDTRLLHYDLQLLYDRVKAHGIRSVALLCEDCEAFDGTLFTELIDVLSSWSDRICFAFVLGISTSADLFQSKLPRTAIRCLEAQQFHVDPVDIEVFFRAMNHKPKTIILGPGLSQSLLDRQRDNIQSPSVLLQSLKYAHMTRVFSDISSVWLDPDTVQSTAISRDLTATKSSQLEYVLSAHSLVQRSMDDMNPDNVSRLLEEDEALAEAVSMAVKTTSSKLDSLVEAIDLLAMLQDGLHKCTGRTPSTWSQLYILAMSNRLARSDLLADTLSSLRRVNSGALTALLRRVDGERMLADIKTARNALEKFMDKVSTDVRSAYDIEHSNLRTTVVAQKVELSRHAAHITPEEASYTKIVDAISVNLTSYFDDMFIDPNELFLHESFIYDTKSLHREVFTPRPRAAIERALSSPHDYLGCGCCDNLAGGLSATQPAIAIIYQLYLESGSIINTADLWNAFWTISGPDKPEDDGHADTQHLALFSRALAELKFLGLIKNSKKRADHLTKQSWKGL